jgi:hypothetical protein
MRWLVCRNDRTCPNMKAVGPDLLNRKCRKHSSRLLSFHSLTLHSQKFIFIHIVSFVNPTGNKWISHLPLGGRKIKQQKNVCSTGHITTNTLICISYLLLFSVLFSKHLPIGPNSVSNSFSSPTILLWERQQNCRTRK